MNWESPVIYAGERQADMEQRYQLAEKLRQEASESLIVEKLRASGLFVS
jgi:hypothetical protein